MCPLHRGQGAGAYVEPNLHTQLAFMEIELAQRRWFAGENFTAADIMMSFPIESAWQQDVLSARRHPMLTGWLDAIRARAPYQRAQGRGKAPFQVG